MNEQLQAAAAEATTDKAEAWAKFTAACVAWCRDVIHSPEDHRALADAACEYAGKRVYSDVTAALLAERDALITSLEATCPRGSTFTPLEQAGRLLRERDAALAEVERLREAIERQKSALKMFERANKTIAMARAPAALKEAANTARRNEAGVQEANAVLTDEVERLTERNAGLAAALREAKKLGTHRIAAGDDYACDVADIADEALEKFTGEKP